MSQFGIIEMTRQRMRPSLKRSIYFDCPHCKGAGLVKTPESMSLDVMRRLAIAINDQRVARIELAVCPDVSFYLNNRKRNQIAALEADTKKRILIRADQTLGLDEMRLDLFDGRDSLLMIEELGSTAPLQTGASGTMPGQQPQHGRGGRRDDRRNRFQPRRNEGPRPAPDRAELVHDEDSFDLDVAEDAVEEREEQLEQEPAETESPVAPAVVAPSRPANRPPRPAMRPVAAPLPAAAAPAPRTSEAHGNVAPEGEGSERTGGRRRRRGRRGRGGRGRGGSRLEQPTLPEDAENQASPSAQSVTESAGPDRATEPAAPPAPVEEAEVGDDVFSEPVVPAAEDLQPAEASEPSDLEAPEGKPRRRRRGGRRHRRRPPTQTPENGDAPAEAPQELVAATVPADGEAAAAPRGGRPCRGHRRPHRLHRPAPDQR